MNFANIQRTTRRKLPFGVAQIGKSFRNEITPGNFVFRTREFEQMELEFFCKPGTDLDWFYYWKDYCKQFILNLGIAEENIRLRDHSAEELSFYSTATTDIEFLFPFGWGELWGIADRTNYDLTQHQTHSGKAWNISILKQTSAISHMLLNHLWALTVSHLRFLCDAYDEEVIDEKRYSYCNATTSVSCSIQSSYFASFQKLGEKAEEVRAMLSKHFMVEYDDAGSIGKRYRRQDEIGTPFCITLRLRQLGRPMCYGS